MSQDLPLLSAKSLRDAVDLDHYLLGAYDTSEQWNLKAVVIAPDLTEPTWVVRPGAKKATRRSILALALPSLDALTLDLAQRLVCVLTEYVTVRRWDRLDRVKGNVVRGDLVPAPWEQGA